MFVAYYQETSKPSVLKSKSTVRALSLAHKALTLKTPSKRLALDYVEQISMKWPTVRAPIQN